ncbi:MAG TPA: 50S ribosomal protein L4 [Phycisphaerae bacterium]|nr:50S ribosomal protein L4 [Phycisphaerae bacterium]
MIEVPVYNMSGERTGAVQVDEAILGGRVRYDLLKQAISAFQMNQWQGSARTKCRSMVEGSTRKLYRQKGTGNARMGTVRTPIRRGGGVAFAKLERNYRREMPRKMRRAARNSALLAKMKAGAVAVIDPLTMDKPKTKELYALFKAVGADQGCVLAIDQPNVTVYKSGRNIPKTEIRQVGDLNAYEILRRRKVLLSKAALDAVLADPATFAPASRSQV